METVLRVWAGADLGGWGVGRGGRFFLRGFDPLPTQNVLWVDIGTF